MWIIKKVSEVDYWLTKKLTMSNLRERKTGYMGKPSECIELKSIFKSTYYDFLAKKYSDFLASTFSWDISYLKFIYSEKATDFCEISNVDLSCVHILTLCRHNKIRISMKVLQANSIILSTRKLWQLFPI